MGHKSHPSQLGFFDGDDPQYPQVDLETECCVEYGDLWYIGEHHRLLCGDCGDGNDIERLLSGRKVHLVHADPPWNVAVDTIGRPHGSKQRGTAKTRMLKNDALSDNEFLHKLYSWFGNIAQALAPGRSFYVWGGYSNCARFPNVIKAVGLHYAQAIIWVKNTSAFSRRDFRAKHEWCFYGWKQRARHPHFFATKARGTFPDVWAFDTVPKQSMLHLTEKPVEIPKRAIECSTRLGELVLDPFAGSGSTLIAAEVIDRVCYLMEIDPWYCSIILDRCKKMGMEVRKE